MNIRNPKSEIQDPKPALWQTPGLSHYYVICLVSVGLIWLVLLRRELPISLSLFPILVGLLGMAVRWRLAPVILLATLAVCLKFESAYEAPRSFRVSDLILCAATLTYVAGQFRLQGMLDHIAPIDPRRREGTPRWHVGLLSIRYQPEVAREKRAPNLVTREEIGLLIVGSALWAGLAQIIWNLLPLERGQAPQTQIFPVTVWRAMVLAWILAAALYILFGLLSYLSQRVMTLEESTLFLQDVLWKETRGEQRRLNRWSAWARLRRRENS
jgi:hypothetical protein